MKQLLFSLLFLAAKICSAQVYAITSSTACAQPCAGIPPVNDSCFHATNFGLLPSPQPCPTATGAVSALAATNLCATQEADHIPSVICSGGNLHLPQADVWFTFDLDSASGPIVNLNITSSTINPAAVLYIGTDCGHMIQLGCALSTTTNLNYVFNGLSSGHYFLQVSSDNDTSQCDFNISLSNDLNCIGCILQAGLTANPPPVDGSYPPATSVNFCFTVSSYSQTAMNWFHAVVPIFGAGWDVFTIAPVPAATCTTGGYWEWVQNYVTSVATGLVHGPGFYYETAVGNALGVIDNDPGNNYGDQNSMNLCDWTFCWTMSTRSDTGYCMDGTNLNVSIDTYGDGESGSWTTYSCDNDPIYYFFADESCCQSLATSVTNSCTLGQSSASATALGAPPFTFDWKDSTGTTISTHTNTTGVDSLQNLFPGNYSVEVTDSSGCLSIHYFTIVTPVQLSIDAVTPTTCIGCGNGSVSFSVIPSGYTLFWSPAAGVLNGTTIDSLPANGYNICVSDTMGCISCDSVTILEDPSFVSPFLLEKSISVFPNPSSGITTVRFTLLKPTAVSIRIFNTIGKEQLLPSDEKILEAGTNEVSFDTKTLGSGFYFVELKTENKTVKRRLVVMKE